METYQLRSMMPRRGHQANWYGMGMNKHGKTSLYVLMTAPYIPSRFDPTLLGSIESVKYTVM